MKQKKILKTLYLNLLRAKMAKPEYANLTKVFVYIKLWKNSPKKGIIKSKEKNF